MPEGPTGCIEAALKTVMATVAIIKQPAMVTALALRRPFTTTMAATIGDSGITTS